MKLMMKFCLCLHKFSELWNLFSLVSIGNCFRCYFGNYLFKNDCKILNIILVPDFCPLEPEIARFSIGLRLNCQLSMMHYPEESANNQMATNEDLMEQRLKTILWLYMYSSTTNLLGKELKPHCQHTELFLFIVQTQLPQQAQKTFLFHSVVPEHSLFGTSSHHCILSYSSPKENQKNMLYWVVCDKNNLIFLS